MLNRTLKTTLSKRCLTIILGLIICICSKADDKIWVTNSENFTNHEGYSFSNNGCVCYDSNGLYYILFSDQTGWCYGYFGNGSNLTIPGKVYFKSNPNTIFAPSSFDGKEFHITSVVNIEMTAHPYMNKYYYSFSNIRGNLTISEGITKIGQKAFWCDDTRLTHKLDTVRIPSTIETIEAFAFTRCDISTIICESHEPPKITSSQQLSPWGNETKTPFSNYDALLLVPKTSIDKYKKTYWKKFSCIEPMPVSVTSFSLKDKLLRMIAGNKYTAEFNISPIDATDDDITWSWKESSPGVISCENGIITAQKEGYATLYASCKEFSDSCQIEVFSSDIQAPRDITITLDKADVSLTWKWEAPESVFTENTTDYDNVTYNIWRIMGRSRERIASGIKETSYTDFLPRYGDYYYTIVPVFCGVEVNGASSDTVTNLFTYFSGFEDYQDGSSWTFIRDGWSIESGTGGKYAQAITTESPRPVDYMISPNIYFSPGTYELSYMVKGERGMKYNWKVDLFDLGWKDALSKVLEIESHNKEEVCKGDKSDWVESKKNTFKIDNKHYGSHSLTFYDAKISNSSRLCYLSFDNVSVTLVPESIPYTCEFRSNGDANLWISESGNSEHGWSINYDYHYVEYRSTKIHNKEYRDLSISPAIHFPTAGSYILTFSAKNSSLYDNDQWGIYLVSHTFAFDYDLPESTKKIVEYDKKLPDSWTKYTVEFNVEMPGIYHICPCFNTSGPSNLCIDDIHVESKSSGIEGVVEIDEIDEIDENAEIIEYFNLQGQRIDKHSKGLVIVRYSNGKTAKKVIR